jgi:hypothetical protein
MRRIIVPSPFPGMDPFLESQLWDDFHADVIPVIRALIIPQVRPRYTVNIERAVFVTSDEGAADRYRPDVMILDSPRATGFVEQAAATATLEPRILTVPEPYEVTQKFLTIRSRDDRRVVTVIELLSPTNKDDKGGQTQYLAKRASYLRTLTNIVAIDLLRGGRRLPTKEPLPEVDYHAFVIRHADRSHAAVYSWSLKDRLPVIPVPLEPDVPDVVIDLQQAFEQTYQRGGYDYTLDYRRDVVPELDAADRQWVCERLGAAGDQICGSS